MDSAEYTEGPIDREGRKIGPTCLENSAGTVYQLCLLVSSLLELELPSSQVMTLFP